MAGFGEPWDWTKKRLAEAASYFPTLSVSNPDDNLNVDAFRDSVGQLPSLFTQSAMGIANYARSLFPEQAPSATSYERPPQFASSLEEMAAGRAVQMGQAAPAPEAAPYQGFGTPSEIAMRGIRSLTDPFRINQEGIDWIMEAAERSGRRQAPFIQAVTGEQPAKSPLDFFLKSQASYGAPEALSAETTGRALYTGYVTSDVPGLKSVAEIVSSPLTYIGAGASSALSPVIKGLPLIPRGILGLADIGIEGGVAARTIQQAAMGGGAEIGAEYAKEQGYGLLGQLGAGLGAGAIAGGISAAPALAAKTFKQAAEEAITAQSRAAESANAQLEEALRRQSQASEDYLRYQTYGVEVPPVRTEAVPSIPGLDIQAVRMENLRQAMDQLPPVEDGYVRLYRGVNPNLQGESYAAEARTMFVEEPTIASQYGQVHYLDVPEDIANSLSRREGFGGRYPVPEVLAKDSTPVESFSEGVAPGEFRPPIGGSAGSIDPSGYVSHPNQTIQNIAQTAVRENRDIPVSLLEETERATDMYQQDYNSRRTLVERLLTGEWGGDKTLFRVGKVEVKPGRIATWPFRKVGSFYHWWDPGTVAPENFVVGWSTRTAVKSRLETFFNRIGWENNSVKTLANAFGDDAISKSATGEPLNIQYVGPRDRLYVDVNGERLQNPNIKTLGDVLRNPDHYNITPEQRAAIADVAHNIEMVRNYVNDEYMANIPNRATKPNSVSLPVIGVGKNEVTSTDVAQAASRRSAIEQEILRKQRQADLLEKRINANGGVQNPKNADLVNRLNNIQSDITSLKAGPTTQTPDELWLQSINEYKSTGNKENLWRPETNINRLIKGMSDSYIQDASFEGMRLSIGGKTEAEVKELLETGLKSGRDALAAKVSSITEKIKSRQARQEVDAISIDRISSVIKTVTDDLEKNARQSGRDNQYIVRRINEIRKRVEGIPGASEEELERQIDNISGRIAMRNAQGARANQSIQSELGDLIQRLDVAKEGNLSKSTIRRLDFIGKHIADLMDDPNLDPNDVPAIKNIMADVIKESEKEFKDVVRPVNSIIDKIDDVVSSAKLNPQEAPAMDALRSDIQSLENELQAKYANRAATRDNEINNLITELGAAKKDLEDFRTKYDLIDPSSQDWVLVGHGVNKYFKGEDAKYADFMFDKPGKVFSTITDFLGNISSAVLGGDLSPIFGQQGWIALLANPVLVTKSIANTLKDSIATGDNPFLHAFRKDTLQKILVENPHFEDYAAALRFSLRNPLAEELSGGWVLDTLAKNTKTMGGRLREANEGLYSAIRVYQMRSMDSLVQSAVASGVPRTVAINAAADIVTKTIPTSTPARFGQSASQLALQRSLFTSYAFATKPIAFHRDVAAGFSKLALQYAGGPAPTVRERMAVNVALKMYGDILGLAVTSHMVSAAATGKDPMAAAFSALNPNDRHNFLSLQIPGTNITVPLGGVHRSLITAIAPKPVDFMGMKNVWVPASGGKDLYNFARYRAAPGIRLGTELITGQKVYGGPVVPRNAESGSALMYYIAHAATSALPLGVAQPIVSYTEGRTLGEGALETGAQFLGLPISLPQKKKTTGVIETMPRIKGMSGPSRSGRTTVPQMGK